MPALYLHPADPLWQPAGPDAVAAILHAVGLIGRPDAPTGPGEFAVGERFMEQVMFLGCAPQPAPALAADGAQPCSIRLHHYQQVRLLQDEPRPAVRCAACRAAVHLSTPYTCQVLYHCEQCGREALLPELDWRKGAGFARFFIEIRGIYPHEAVPSDALLNTLGGLSGGDWDYFYIRR